MKRILFAALLAAAPAAARAQSCTSTTVDQFTFTSCDDGSRYTSNRIDQFTFTTGRDGRGHSHSCTTSHISQFDHTDCH